MQQPTPAVPSDRSGTNKPIYVWAPTRTQKEALISLLGFVDSETVLPLDELDESVLTEGGANVLIAWQGFVPCICAEMESGVMPGSARDKWVDRTVRLLEILRRQKKHILSANIMAVEQEPAVTRNLLTDIFGYRFRNDAPLQSPQVTNPGPLLMHIAFQTFSKSVAARRAQAELQAFSRINLKAGVGPQDPAMDVLLSEIQAQSSREGSAVSKLAEASSLNDALAEDLDRARRAVENSNAFKAREIEQLSTGFRETISNLEKQLDTVRSENVALTATTGELQDHARDQKRHFEDQLSWTFSEIERNLKVSQALEDRTHVLESDNARLEEDLKKLESNAETLRQSVREYADHVEALQNSTSWRVTRPLRWIKQKLSTSRHG